MATEWREVPMIRTLVASINKDYYRHLIVTRRKQGIRCFVAKCLDTPGRGGKSKTCSCLIENAMC